MSTIEQTMAPLIDGVAQRVHQDKQDGDTAYFNSLVLELEYLIKVAVSALIACVGDDSGRNRYGLEHKIVRADSLGVWSEVADKALTGPPAQYILSEASHFTRELNERVSGDAWQGRAVEALCSALNRLGTEVSVGRKTNLRQFFQLATKLRNRTRGHGATTSQKAAVAARDLEAAVSLFKDNLGIFRCQWAHLRRNLSGKYRVTPLAGDSTSFRQFAKSDEHSVPNGVYVDLGRVIRVPLVFVDPDLQEIYLPNGNFNKNGFEVLSYRSDDVRTHPAEPWREPPGALPSSETEGLECLNVVGGVLANLPAYRSAHIPRPVLEQKIKEELLGVERHPVITLTGPGGIGKTTLALATVNEVARTDCCPYEVVLWISSRDIDLLETGPKPVAPRALGVNDVCDICHELTASESERRMPRQDKNERVARYLSEGISGSTLFVFDNFETLTSPTDVFSWIDTHIRPPNKALITTRARDFVGDFPIDIGGMADDEAEELIEVTSKRLGINALLTSDYKASLIRESDGHPYVIKVFLGQVADEGRLVSPKRVVAGADELLKALFQRTYEGISPAAQKVFLLLASWRAYVPEVAIEAVLLRPGNERFDVRAALAELRRFSLIEEVSGEADSEVFYGVPLAAANFGRKKLEASRFKAAVEEDRRLLMEFGPGTREGAQHGVLQRVERLIASVAEKASKNPSALDEFLPVLEFLASKVPETYLRLNKLVQETPGVDPDGSKALKYLELYIEEADSYDKSDVWQRVAVIRRAQGDAVGEVHALCEAALDSSISVESMGVYASQINNRIRELKGQKVEEAWSLEVKELLGKVARAMDDQMSKLSATDCSRLAWQYLNIGNENRARVVVETGLSVNPENEHCLNLRERLDGGE